MIRIMAREAAFSGQAVTPYAIPPAAMPGRYRFE
jgi:hypothetical protein